MTGALDHRSQWVEFIGGVQPAFNPGTGRGLPPACPRVPDKDQCGAGFEIECRRQCLVTLSLREGGRATLPNG